MPSSKPNRAPSAPDPDPAVLEEKIRKILARYPGVVSGFTQAIDMRVSEMLSGVTSAVAIKLTGPELAGLEEFSSRIEEIVSEVPGAIDVARSPARISPDKRSRSAPSPPSGKSMAQARLTVRTPSATSSSKAMSAARDQRFKSPLPPWLWAAP